MGDTSIPSVRFFDLFYYPNSSSQLFSGGGDSAVCRLIMSANDEAFFALSTLRADITKKLEVWQVHNGISIPNVVILSLSGTLRRFFEDDGGFIPHKSQLLIPVYVVIAFRPAEKATESTVVCFLPDLGRNGNSHSLTCLVYLAFVDLALKRSINFLAV